MTVAASPADLPPGSAPNVPQAVGKGQSLLNAIAAQQAIVNAAVGPFVVPAQAQLNQLQIQAVDYFMGSYWVSADQIIATFTSSFPTAGKYGVYITNELNLIAARQAVVNALIAAGPLPITQGNQAPQYSRSYPQPMAGYPLTLPDTRLYHLQTRLVDFLMNTGVVPASLILSTMTGAQTYPWNGYVSNYTYFSDSTEGDSGADL